MDTDYEKEAIKILQENSDKYDVDNLVAKDSIINILSIRDAMGDLTEPPVAELLTEVREDLFIKNFLPTLIVPSLEKYKSKLSRMVGSYQRHFKVVNENGDVVLTCPPLANATIIGDKVSWKGKEVHASKVIFGLISRANEVTANSDKSAATEMISKIPDLLEIKKDDSWEGKWLNVFRHYKDYVLQILEYYKDEFEDKVALPAVKNSTGITMDLDDLE